MNYTNVLINITLVPYSRLSDNLSVKKSVQTAPPSASIGMQHWWCKGLIKDEIKGCLSDISIIHFLSRQSTFHHITRLLHKTCGMKFEKKNTYFNNTFDHSLLFLFF